MLKSSCRWFIKQLLSKGKIMKTRQNVKFDWTEVSGTVMALLWFAVFPLWNGGSYAHLTKDKWLGMSILTGLSVILCLLSVIPVMKKKKAAFLHPEKPLPSMFAVYALGIFLLLWLGLACCFGAWHTQLNPQGQPAVLFGFIRYDGFITMLTCALVFLCMSLPKPRIRIVLWGAAIALDLAFLLAAVQYFNVNPLGLFPKGTGILLNYEFQSTIGNIDFVSLYICLLLPLMLGAWLLEPAGGFFLASALLGVEWLLCMDVKSSLLVLLEICFFSGLTAFRFARYRAKMLAFLGGVFVMLSLRRMIRLPWLDGVKALSFFCSGEALLPLLPALLLAGAFFFRHRPGRDVPRRVFRIVVLLLLLLTLVIFLLLDLPESSGSWWEIQQVLKGRPESRFGSARIAVWEHAWHLALKHPFFGQGPGTFYFALQSHLSEEGASLPETFDSTHSMPLDVLMSGGFPALACWLSLLGLLLFRGLRQGGWSAVFALSMAAYLLEGLFVFSVCVISPVFWAAAGLCCAIRRNK